MLAIAVHTSESPGAKMIAHRIATQDLQREAFASNFIQYLALFTGCGAGASISRYARVGMQWRNGRVFLQVTPTLSAITQELSSSFIEPTGGVKHR